MQNVTRPQRSCAHLLTFSRAHRPPVGSPLSQLSPLPHVKIHQSLPSLFIRVIRGSNLLGSIPVPSCESVAKPVQKSTRKYNAFRNSLKMKTLHLRSYHIASAKRCKFSAKPVQIGRARCNKVQQPGRGRNRPSVL